jgi:UDP-N-acetylmuramoylalanine--D-glutamate ligase
MLPKPPDHIAARLTRPVAIFGAGVSGQGVRLLLEAIGATGVIYDRNSAGAESSFTSARAATHELVIYSPGFAPEHPWLATARAAGCACYGELDFASLFWEGELIAITGTNGKTTLTEFLAHALTTAGRRAHITGNIGYPFSRFVVEQAGRTDVAVCEISSFQAETLEWLRPTATLWTNFAEDHLERHPGMDAYFTAKWRLIERTSPEATFVGSSVQSYDNTTQHKGLTLLPASACIASEGQQADARLAGSVFAEDPQRENFILAAAWWRHAGLPEATLFAAAQTFQVGQHRLARVGERNGVVFWNDSKATNFHAVEAALSAFAGPVLWIGGGKAKGGDLAGFVKRIAARVRHAFLIGETQPALAVFCRISGVPVTPCDSLEQAVRSAFAHAREGDPVLLSPGFASFDMFRGYDDRGRQFESIVQNL